MQKVERRKILQATTALAASTAAIPLFANFEPASSNGLTADTPGNDSSSGSNSSDTKQAKSDNNAEKQPMQLHYLEIVTSDAAALCELYVAAHGITFGDPEPSLGNARIATLDGGSKLAIRGPLRPDEAPVIRPYIHVKDLSATIAAAEKAGAEVAIPQMEIPGHGTIGIVILGGIECGYWQT